LVDPGYGTLEVTPLLFSHAALEGLEPEKKPGLIRRSPLSEHGPF
jgi:hypothetical protein